MAKQKRNFYGLIFLLTVSAVLTGVIFLQQLAAKKDYLDVYILGSSGDWWYDTPRPPYWLINSISVGDTESSTGNKTEAEVLEVKAFPDGPNKIVLLKVRLLVTKNKKTGVYRYKQKPVEVGSTLVLSLSNTRFSGSVVSIDGRKSDLTTQTLKVKLKLYDRYPWFVDQVTIGDTQTDIFSGQPTLAILDKRVSLAEKTTVNDDGQALARRDPWKRDLELTVKLEAYVNQGNYFFAFLQPVKVGGQLWIPMPGYNLFEAYVVQVEADN